MRWCAPCAGSIWTEGHDDLARRGRRVTDSALSVLTGIHRKEVRAFMEAHHEPTGASGIRFAPDADTGFSALSQWITDPDYREPAGEIRRELPRHGPAPSFEALAREASRDVHPRTLLEELERLQLVEVQPERVRLLSDRFVLPLHDPAAVRTMAVNVADHIAAAVHNLQAEVPSERLLEQSVFADGLSAASAHHLGEVARQLLGRGAGGHGARGARADRPGCGAWLPADTGSFRRTECPGALRDLLPS